MPDGAAHGMSSSMPPAVRHRYGGDARWSRTRASAVTPADVVVIRRAALRGPRTPTLRSPAPYRYVLYRFSKMKMPGGERQVKTPERRSAKPRNRTPEDFRQD